MNGFRKLLLFLLKLLAFEHSCVLLLCQIIQLFLYFYFSSLVLS